MHGQTQHHPMQNVLWPNHKTHIHHSHKNVNTTFALNIVDGEMDESIFAEYLILVNKISLNISTVYQISHKFMSCDHHKTKGSR